tara:strand:+ start:442 stop:603 length:162 start_codon:yes stop_codon:yes gene_type:complete
MEIHQVNLFLLKNYYSYQIGPNSPFLKRFDITSELCKYKKIKLSIFLVKIFLM